MAFPGSRPWLKARDDIEAVAVGKNPFDSESVKIALKQVLACMDAQGHKIIVLENQLAEEAAARVAVEKRVGDLEDRWGSECCKVDVTSSAPSAAAAPLPAGTTPPLPTSAELSHFSQPYAAMGKAKGGSNKLGCCKATASEAAPPSVQPAGAPEASASLSSVDWDSLAPEELEAERRKEQRHRKAQAASAEYPDPAQPWLAWARDETWGKERCLKCLICNKWVQDFDDTNTVGYKGAHGELGPGNQKDHKKKMQDLQKYMRDPAYWDPIVRERQRWHPSATAQSAQPVELARPVAASATALPAPPDVPEGWAAQWSREHALFYYYRPADGVAQWDPPSPALVAAPENFEY